MDVLLAFLLLSTTSCSVFGQIYDRYAGYQLRPGGKCDPSLWNQIVAPVSDSLRELYLSQGTSDYESARSRYQFTSREEFNSKLRQALNLDLGSVEEKEIVNIERSRVLSFDLCKGMEAPYLNCKEDANGNEKKDEGRCTCKSDFPFEYSTLAQIYCVPRSGSICAIGGDFLLNCADKQRCLRGPDNITYYCGGWDAFDARRRTLNPDRDFSTAAWSRKSNLIVILTAILMIFGAVVIIND